jgi:putative transposase
MDGDKNKRSFLNAVNATPGSLKALTFHSDQGVQYCSKAVRDKLSLLDITQSMSRKGNCYDNAFVESFFHTLKNELEKTCFDNLAEAKKMIFEYINWYNRERLHSSLGYLSPVDYVETTNRLVA